MSSLSLSPLLSLLTILALVVSGSAQQTITGSFSGAFQAVTGGSGSAAVPAECPAHAPVSCSSIGATGWCCPSSNNCGWNGGSVGCCPWGQSCGTYAAAGGQQWQPTTSYWQPTTTWQQQQTVTVYQQPTTYEQGQYYTTTQAAAGAAAGQYNGYCSTEYANGPGLPTTGQGQCGTILILQAGANMVYDRSALFTLLGGALVMHAFAWVLLLRR